MCLAAPVLVTRIENDTAWVRQGGAEQAISIVGVDGITVGDYVLHHAGLALARLEPEEAAAILAALELMDSLDWKP
ncbi:MAG: HypC/HybG/HupF family hydrogenase formation chaperone [Chloroflexi bacterium]|nr:HypC/HybG/HupF family hydrogenase formation chaperone [Chloroflexota bacterium]